MSPNIIEEDDYEERPMILSRLKGDSIFGFQQNKADLPQKFCLVAPFLPRIVEDQSTERPT